MHKRIYCLLNSVYIPLGATAQGKLWPPEQSASILIYSESDLLVSEQFSFYGVRLLASRQTPTWRTRVSLFVWLVSLDLSAMGDPTSSYATAGVALRVSGALKPHHHDKVEIPSVGIRYTYRQIIDTCLETCRKS
jgi:hypothetical protein